MAKKVAVVDDEEKDEQGHARVKKKKHSKCCTCCLIFCIVMLVIFAVAFGVGWYFGDKFTKSKLGMSLGDTFGVIGDLYWTDDEDVVRRPYSANDINGFYSEIKRNILLKDSAEVDFDTALADAVEKFLTSDDQSNAQGGAMGARNTSENGEETDSGSQITDILVDMIADVLNRDNIDVERLNAYNESDPSTDEYIFRLNDRELAAFVNAVLRNVLKNADKVEGFSDVAGMMDLSSIVALKQIMFKAQSEKSEGGEDVVVASSADITLWLGLQDAAGQALKSMLDDAGWGWIGGMAAWLGDVFLPENVYITLGIPLYGDGKATVVINDMDASEQARANKLINGILSMSGNNKTLDEVLDGFVEQIRPMLEKATDKMNFAEAGSGTISLDLLQTLTEMASEEMEGEPLTKADFIYMLQALFSDMDAQLDTLTPYRYDNWYMDGGKPVYKEEGGNPADRIDYEDAFIRELADKYALDVGESSNLNEVLAMLGISLDGNSNVNSEDMLDRVNSAKFKELLNENNLNNIKLIVTDRMLGAALSKQTDKMLQGTEGLENLTVKLDALTFVAKSDPQKADHKYALIAAEVDLTGMLDEVTAGMDSLISKLASGLMPESVLLTVTVDITRDRSVTRDPAEFIINSCDNTDRALAALEKLVKDLDFNDIATQIGDTLNDMLDQLDSKLSTPIELRTHSYTSSEGGWVGAAGAVVLPDIFTVITDIALVNELPDGTRERVVSPEQLKAVINDLNAPGVIESDIPTTGYASFIDEVMDKYYFKRDPAHPVTSFDDLTAYMTDFDSDKFRTTGSDGLAHDTRTIEQLTPVMEGGELGALIKEKMSGNTLVGNYDIVKAASGNNRLDVVLVIELSSLMENASQVTKLIDTDKLYVTAQFDLDDAHLNGEGTPDDPYGYKVGMKINVAQPSGVGYMSEENFDAMMNIVRFFSPSFDIQKQMDEVGVVLYEQMQKLNESIASAASGADAPVGPADPVDVKYFTFTDNGLEIVDFYTFLALKMQPDLLNDSNAEALKETLQGLYIKDSASPNPNNYSADDIIRNAPSTSVWGGKEILGTHLDSDFNAFLKQDIEMISSGGEVSVEQTVILAKGDSGAAATSVRGWLNAHLKQNMADADYVTTGSDYLVITFSMSMADYIGQNKDGSSADKISAGLFPDKIYATVVFRYDDVANRFVKVPETADGDKVPSLIFNNMNYEQYRIMVRLMGATPESTDDGKVNIVSVTSKCEDVLNGIIDMGMNVAFAKAQPADIPAGKNAVGKITISRS